MKKIHVFLGLIVLFIFILGTKVNATTEINSWLGLKEAIENNSDSNIEIKLKPGNWTANSTITIRKKQNVTIKADENITITRDASFKGTLIANNGILTIEGKDSDKNIVFDGNGRNVIANYSLIKNYFSILYLKAVKHK